MILKFDFQRYVVSFFFLLSHPTALSRIFGVKRGEQPLFRGSSASKSLALFWFSFGVKREHPSATTSAPAERILNRYV